MKFTEINGMNWTVKKLIPILETTINRSMKTKNVKKELRVQRFVLFLV